MEALIEAIGTRYDVQKKFSNVCTGGLHLGETPNEEDVPYCVFMVIEEPEWTYEVDFEVYTVTFFLVSGDQSALQILNLYTSLKACFDEAPLVVSGYHLIRFWRRGTSEGPARVEDQWTLSIQYACELQKES